MKKIKLNKQLQFYYLFISIIIFKCNLIVDKTIEIHTRGDVAQKVICYLLNETVASN